MPPQTTTIEDIPVHDIEDEVKELRHQVSELKQRVGERPSPPKHKEISYIKRFVIYTAKGSIIMACIVLVILWSYTYIRTKDIEYTNTSVRERIAAFVVHPIAKAVLSIEDQIRDDRFWGII